MKISAIAALLLVLSLSMGCAKSPQGNADVNLITGRLTSEEAAPVPDVFAAAERAVHDLGLTAYTKEVDGLIGVIEAETADGESVDIRIEYRTPGRSMVIITPGGVGDRFKAEGLLTALRDRLYAP